MEDLEEVTIMLHEVVGPSRKMLNVPKLLIALGMAESGVEAMRALAGGGVTLDGKISSITVKLPALPARIVVGIGEQSKVAVLVAKPEGQKIAERTHSAQRVRNKTPRLRGRPIPGTMPA